MFVAKKAQMNFATKLAVATIAAYFALQKNIFKDEDKEVSLSS